LGAVKAINNSNEGLTQADRWTDRRGIAGHFKVSERTVSNLMRRRVLPVTKIGRIVRFNVAACEAALKAFELRSVAQIGALS
jgi:hypothetical protein